MPRNQPQSVSHTRESLSNPETIMVISIRVIFVLTLAAVGLSLVSADAAAVGWLAQNPRLVYVAFLGLALVVIALDAFIPRKSLTALSGLFFGLTVGMIVAYGLSLILDLIVVSTAGEYLGGGGTAFDFIRPLLRDAVL